MATADPCAICGLPDSRDAKPEEPNCIIHGGDRCYRRGFGRLQRLLDAAPKLDAPTIKAALLADPLLMGAVGISIMVSGAPVRLQQALACHIDHDEPPGMAAREVATAVLELLDGACNDQRVFELHQALLDLKERFRS